MIDSIGGGKSLRWVLKKGSLSRRGRIYWLQYYSPETGKRVRVSLETTNPLEAEERRREIIAQACGLTVNNPKMGIALPEGGGGNSDIPLNTILPDFESYLLNERQRRKKSARSDVGRIRQFFERCHISKLEEATPTVLRDFMKRALREGAQPKTLNNYHSILHQFFSFAVRERGFSIGDPNHPNPVALVECYKVPHSGIDFMELEDIQRQILGLVQYPQLRTMVATYIYAGLRREEALWLTRKDVRLRAEKPLISVCAKKDGNTILSISTAPFCLYYTFRQLFVGRQTGGFSGGDQKRRGCRGGGATS
jgi:hypothetical protein